MSNTNFLATSSNYLNKHSSQSVLSKCDLTTHDIKNILFVISGYISMGKYKSAQEKIDKICEIVSQSTSIDTQISDNYFLNALFSSKFHKMDTLNIKFEYINKLTNPIYINESDLCVLIGNALDNSIEACQKITSLNKKFIKIILCNDAKFVYIKITNSIAHPNFTLSTSKCNPHGHGLGLKSIKNIIGHYGGSMSIIQNKNIFTLNMRFLNKHSQQNI